MPDYYAGFSALECAECAAQLNAKERSMGLGGLFGGYFTPGGYVDDASSTGGSGTMITGDVGGDSGGGVLDSIWGFVKSAAGSVAGAGVARAQCEINPYGQGCPQQPKTSSSGLFPQPSSLPSWVLPVGLGAAALVLFLVLRKKS